MKNKNYFITGGGTGGHIYPAIAVADKLLEYETTNKIYYVGNPNNLEATIVKDKSYKFLPVISSGMPRKINFGFILWVYNMFRAFRKCLKYIKKYKPDIIFGTGGYVSAPVLLAAIVTNKPFIMHDCDANPGLVTRVLSPFAKSISIAFDSARNQLKNQNCYVNGNPIRKEFKSISKEQARNTLNLSNKKTLCIMGGSQGARSINDATVEILKTLSQKYDLQIIFQTGKKKYNDVVEKIKKIYPEYATDKNIIIKPYFDDMISVLKSSDIAISRAGSLSISEICASSVAAIFIPYPYAAADHQRKNAHIMQEKNAGLYLEDSQATPENLLKYIESLILDNNKLELIQKNAQNMAKYDGVEKIISQMDECIGEE